MITTTITIATNTASNTLLLSRNRDSRLPLTALRLLPLTILHYDYM